MMEVKKAFSQFMRRWGWRMERHHIYATFNDKPISKEEWDEIAKPGFEAMERMFKEMERVFSRINKP